MQKKGTYPGKIARDTGLRGSWASDFLGTKNKAATKGVSFETIDTLAEHFGVEPWQMFAPSEDHLDATDDVGVKFDFPTGESDAQLFGGAVMEEQDRRNLATVQGAFSILLGQASPEIRTRFAKEVLQRAWELIGQGQVEVRRKNSSA